MKKLFLLLSVLFLIYWGCEDKKTVNENNPFYSFILEYKNTGMNKNENNYFHLPINRNNSQTLYRIKGKVFKNNQSISSMKFD